MTLLDNLKRVERFLTTVAHQVGALDQHRTAETDIVTRTATIVTNSTATSINSTTNNNTVTTHHEDHGVALFEKDVIKNFLSSLECVVPDPQRPYCHSSSSLLLLSMHEEYLEDAGTAHGNTILSSSFESQQQQKQKQRQEQQLQQQQQMMQQKENVNQRHPSTCSHILSLKSFVPLLDRDEEEAAFIEYYQKALNDLQDGMIAGIVEPPTMLDDSFGNNKQMPKNWKISLMQYIVLSSPRDNSRSNTASTIQQLAKYSARGKIEAMNVFNLLHDENLLKDILYHGGGPKNQQYMAMMEIYHDILHQSPRAQEGVSSNDIFHRLALATALEHAVPLCVFDSPNVVIDPVERYKHYEDAYIRDELDEYFSTLSIWELRMVVNCDASNEEMVWCREMLRNYRPDHILDRNDQWKYCMIVKTDVRYKTPA